MKKINKPQIIDLFCGCSGLGLGARQAGCDVIASFDVDSTLTSSHSLNFPDGRLILGDISELDGAHVRASSSSRIDGVIGGPPCQGFSSIGKSDPNDPRREMLGHFFRIVNQVRPRFFLMENVQGLIFNKNRDLLDNALHSVQGSYEIVGPMVLDALNFGAPTSRKRVFVFGYDPNEFNSFSISEFENHFAAQHTVRDAIYDLRTASSLGDENGFDHWSYGESEIISSYATSLRTNDSRFTGHTVTIHRAEIAERFSQLMPGKTDPVGRHPRLSWDGYCPTLRAGTGADKGSFQSVRPIHPEFNRVITVREAARIQGFPDWFKFHPTIWHSFRMIGNSVSPIIAQSLLSLIINRSNSSSDMLAAE